MLVTSEKNRKEEQLSERTKHHKETERQKTAQKEVETTLTLEIKKISERKLINFDMESVIVWN